MSLALAPLSLLLFGQVSLIGLVANAMAIPWVTLVITPLGMLGVLFSPLWSVAAWALQVLTELLTWLARMPLADLHLARAPLWAGLAGLCGGALLAMRMPPVVRLAGLPLLLPVLFWEAPRPAVGEFELLAADIGQGNAVIVQTTAHALLYDAGPRFSADSDAGHRVIVPLLRALDLRLDAVVISHRDTDHVGGAETVLAQQPQAQLITSMTQTESLQVPDLVRRCEAGQHWTWDGVHFDVLHPSAQDYEQALKPNPMSCVLRISNGQRTALLVGDIEKAQEARLVNEGASLRADVLLVPHHGSKTSSSDAFLEAVQPRFGLVQSSYRNRYGHPAPVVLQRYEAHGVKVLDSPRCGAQRWQSWVPERVQCQRDIERRYWHHQPP
jgi:competence protein ComEC